jgi:hypothetical protein
MCGYDPRRRYAVASLGAVLLSMLLPAHRGESDRRDVLELERRLLPDDLALVP